MARKIRKIIKQGNKWLLFSTIVLFVVSIILFMVNANWDSYNTDTRMNVLLLLAISTALFSISLAWYTLSLFRKRKGWVWAIALAQPFGALLNQIVIIGKWANWGTLGGGESYIIIFLGLGVFFGVIAGLITLIGDIIMMLWK